MRRATKSQVSADRGASAPRGEQFEHGAERARTVADRILLLGRRLRESLAELGGEEERIVAETARPALLLEYDAGGAAFGGELAPVGVAQSDDRTELCVPRLTLEVFEMSAFSVSVVPVSSMSMSMPRSERESASSKKPPRMARISRSLLGLLVAIAIFIFYLKKKFILCFCAVIAVF